jgi:betaine-aldehyde dehydrogenase
LGTAVLGNEADIDAAVRAARRALDVGPWGGATVNDRAEIMRRFASALSARAAEVSTLVSHENGMPITLSAVANGAAPASLLTMYADMVENTALDSYVFGDVAQEIGLPPGVLNIVLAGRDAG